MIWQLMVLWHKWYRWFSRNSSTLWTSVGWNYRIYRKFRLSTQRSIDIVCFVSLIRSALPHQSWFTSSPVSRRFSPGPSTSAWSCQRWRTEFSSSFSRNRTRWSRSSTCCSIAQASTSALAKCAALTAAPHFYLTAILTFSCRRWTISRKSCSSSTSRKPIRSIRCAANSGVLAARTLLSEVKFWRSSRTTPSTTASKGWCCSCLRMCKTPIFLTILISLVSSKKFSSFPWFRISMLEIFFKTEMTPLKI